MKRYAKTKIKAAGSTSGIMTAEVDDQLADTVATLQDDFDFILAGIEQLGRMGKEGTITAQSISMDLSHSLSGIRSAIAENL